MTTRDRPPIQSGSSGHSCPKINTLTMFRLGLFQMGLGVLTVLTVGVLNRVMITELSIPEAITSTVLAISLLVAPARIWVGQVSDAKPLGRYHRTGYVWIGAACFMAILLAAVQVVWQLGALVQLNGGWSWTTPIIGWTALLALLMGLYGLVTSLSSTSFFALLVDVSDDDDRGKLIGIVWTMLMVGLAIGGISSKILLSPLDDINASIDLVQRSVTHLFWVVPLIVFGLAIAATVGVETKYSRYSYRSMAVNREDQITLGAALRVLTASRQTVIFFVFLLMMTFSLFLQETVLEPYGGEVFQMSIPETSLLNTYWAIGLLLSLSATGFFLIPRLGKRRTTKLGCLAVAFSFFLIILSGFTANENMLRLALVLFGMATGILTTGALSLTLDLTAAETAGTFSGAWGLAQSMARGVAVAGGGYVLGFGKMIFDSPVLAYGVVFSLQAIGMVLAIGVLNRVNVQEFRSTTNEAIATVLKNDLD
ncbi:MAG: BCD family MFS transporter [Elainellaceae cyanobacterium]